MCAVVAGMAQSLEFFSDNPQVVLGLGAIFGGLDQFVAQITQRSIDIASAIAAKFRRELAGVDGHGPSPFHSRSS